MSEPDGGNREQVSLFNELLMQVRNNLECVYCAWRDFSKNPKYNDHPIILFMEVDSVFQTWKNVTFEAILHSKLPSIPEGVEDKWMLKAFDFLSLENRMKTSCGVFVNSKKETFYRPFFLINFSTFFDVTNISQLEDESFVLGKLKLDAIVPEQYDDQWYNGVVSFTGSFFGQKPQFYRILPLLECKDQVSALVNDRKFYEADICLKLNNPCQLGFGMFDDDLGELYGFAMFKFESVDTNAKTVTLHIEYLCKNTEAPANTGLQLALRCVKTAQNEYPGYSVTAFTEAKPTEQAIGFWLKKMGFEVDSDVCIDGAYYPSYKLYSGNAILRDYVFER